MVRRVYGKKKPLPGSLRVVPFRVWLGATFHKTDAVQLWEKLMTHPDQSVWREIEGGFRGAYPGGCVPPQLLGELCPGPYESNLLERKLSRFLESSRETMNRLTILESDVLGTLPNAFKLPIFLGLREVITGVHTELGSRLPEGRRGAR